MADENPKIFANRRRRMPGGYGKQDIYGNAGERYRIKVQQTPVPESNWILATGFWNDDGVWDDTKVWID